jgi:phospholipid/cholesterol/gamma-HCH transport system substrate-binding protein
MPQKKQVRLAELKLGIFIVAAIILFLALILQQSWGLKWFSESVHVVTYLTDVGGLKSGAPVWLAGIEIGRVKSVSIIKPEDYEGNAQVYRRIEEITGRISALQASPELSASRERDIRDLYDDIRDLKQRIRMVEVLLDIQAEYLDRIGVDSEVSIESKGLIGDSFIDISPGATGIKPARKGDYYIIESVQNPGFREIMTGANDVVANFGVLSEHFKDLTQRITSDSISGGVTNILNDAQKTVSQANKTFSQATSLLAAMEKGDGTIGKLVSDPALYNRLVESLEKFNTLAENIQNGNGTLGRFIKDPSLYESASATLQKADSIMARIEKGEGTLGKLTTDEAMYERTTAALERFATLMEEVNRGEGTLGKLLKDPSLYNNLDQSTAEITKLLYDIRKDPKKFLTIRFKLF